MDTLPILQNGDPRLREVVPALPESLFGTEELMTMIEQMSKSLDEEPDGVALAANQVGIPYRIFIVRYDRTESDAERKAATASGAAPKPADVGVYINPTFIRSSRRRVDMDEGCLSVRGLYGTTLRHERATVRAYDVHGKKFERGAGGLLAQIFQHETDHLNGLLFIDHAIDIIEVKKRADEVSDTTTHEPS